MTPPRSIVQIQLIRSGVQMLKFAVRPGMLIIVMDNATRMAVPARPSRGTIALRNKPSRETQPGLIITGCHTTELTYGCGAC